MSDQEGEALTLQELPELRRKTAAVSQFLREQISAHMETLRPLFGAERVFGKHAGGKTDVTGAERALAELQQSYKTFTRKPYELPETLDLNWLGLAGNTLELHAWEYLHQVQSKPVTITSPVRWLVNYRSNYSLAQVKAALDGKQNARPEHLHQFVVNSLVLQSILSRNPGLKQLFADLRYDLSVETPAELKGLPVVTLKSCLASFRPNDDLISTAIAFSGVQAFIELLDIRALNETEDPLKSRLEGLLK